MTVVHVDGDDLLAHPRAPAGDAVVVSSADSIYLWSDPVGRIAWWVPLHAPPPGGGYRPAPVFRRPFGAAWAGGMWLAPEIQVCERAAP
jgi:hypothetical protein